MRQNELVPPPGSHHARKRVGRGDSSGHGSYSGRGQKGQKSRAGQKLRSGFEGGQLAMVKRLPQKRGFTNPFRVEYNIVKVGQLSRFAAGTEVTERLLLASRLIRSPKRPVKVLGDGEVGVPLTVKAHKFSASARHKIEAAGGKVEEIANAAQ